MSRLPLRRELERREATQARIRVGGSTAGWMGTGFIAAMERIPGMELCAVAHSSFDDACRAFVDAGVPYELILETDSPWVACDAIRMGRRVITEDPTLLARIEVLDVIADATSSPATGADVAQSCIVHGKDVVLINIEADVTVGRILRQKAERAGIVYSLSSGDEPGCLMELYDFVTALGYEVIAIGKGKNNPLDPFATPETVAEAARAVGKDAYQTASYIDGTKTMFEMTCAANATGCRPMRRGMVGPNATLENISQMFALVDDGGICEFPGVVDFVQGNALAGGVFVTVRVEDERIADDLNYLKVGQGKYFTFYRPYHLWFLEAPISIARVNLYKEPWMAPLDAPMADVIAIAKRDLKAGDILDDFGGYTTYGLIETASAAKRLHALPMGLTPGARMIRSVRAGHVIGWNDVALDEESAVVRLRREQDARTPSEEPPDEEFSSTYWVG